MIRKFLGYVWGVIVRPGDAFDELARETSIRPGVMMAIIVLLLNWLSWVLLTLFRYDWLGTRRELTDPTYVGFFGRLPVGLENYTLIFLLVVAPLLALLGPVFVPGLVHMLSKLWRGQGTFEQMVNTMAFANVPSVLFQAILNDLILGGVPTNLLTGHPYAFTAAMNGEFGPVWSALVWIYMFGFYIFGVGAWIVALGTVAIHRVQHIPWIPAALIMLLAYLLSMYGLAGTLVR